MKEKLEEVYTHTSIARELIAVSLDHGSNDIMLEALDHLQNANEIIGDLKDVSS